MKTIHSARFKVLKALLPYSRENIQLSFKPNSFFNTLELSENIAPPVSRNAYYRAIKQGLVELDDNDNPRLTDKGLRQLAPYTAQQLKDASLMVVFDIPEHARWKRDKLRGMLREFSFVQVQKSVWLTKLDCKEYVTAEINNLALQDAVKIYEAAEINT